MENKTAETSSRYPKIFHSGRCFGSRLVQMGHKVCSTLPVRIAGQGLDMARAKMLFTDEESNHDSSCISILYRSVLCSTPFPAVLQTQVLTKSSAELLTYHEERCVRRQDTRIARRIVASMTQGHKKVYLTEIHDGRLGKARGREAAKQS